ncbi:MAG: sulfite exporter TauE/SafE family protein [Alphaproteobacteria bacterium]|nr:sulfite exporter TauE/SafE family protein [Alphaproteobacteria bacterium]
MDTLFSASGPYFSVTLFFVGILTGLIGAMGGSGGLILVPFMVSCGIPPALALGTARFAAIGAWVIAFKKFNKAGQIRWKQLPFIATIAVFSGALGTCLIIEIDEQYVYPIVGTLLILVSPLALLKKDFGLVAKDMGQKSTILGYLIYALVMIYGGFFGAGTGIMAIFVLVTFLGFRAFEAHATEITAWIVMSVISSAIFIYHDKVNYSYALIIFLSMAIGSYIGSHFALKGGDKWIKRIVCLFSFIIGIKLLVWG